MSATPSSDPSCPRNGQDGPKAETCGPFPDADRYIPATPALLEGWEGFALREESVYPVAIPGYVGDATWLRLDLMRPEVRDHLIRRLPLPAWMRDGAGLEPWQSAGLIACAAADMRAAPLRVVK